MCVVKDSLYFTFTLTTITPSEGGSLKCQQVAFHDVGYVLRLRIISKPTLAGTGDIVTLTLMAHHPRLQRDTMQGTASNIPTGPMTPPPPFQPPQVLPLMGRDPVSTGGPGDQCHITGPRTTIPPYLPSHGTPLYPPLGSLPFQHPPFQHPPLQRPPFQHPPFHQFQPAPPQPPPFQHMLPQPPSFQHMPPQPPPFQHAPFQHSGLTTALLPWGYTYPAPLPAPVPHQVLMRPSGQALPVEQKVVNGGKGGPAVVPTEATHPGRSYPNPLISNGSKSLLTFVVLLDTEVTQFGSSWLRSTMPISNEHSKPGRI